VHQPLPPAEYAGWVVPKKMNRLGALTPALKGFFVAVERKPEREPQPEKDLTSR
jgi:ubiquinol-cytochrome c reductase cytochrome b subunit